MVKTVVRFCLLVCLVSLLGACERRLLVDITEKVNVRVYVKINEILNVTTGFYNEAIPVPEISPRVIRVMFYDPDTKVLRTQGFITRKGVDAEGQEYIEGEISVRPGTYDILCYNFDTPSTLINNESNLNTINAYTSEISDGLYSRFETRTSIDGVRPSLYYEPDHLLVSREERVHIPEHTGVYYVETEASTVVDSYYIQVRLKNGRYISDATAVLTDISPSNKIGLNERKHDEYAGTFFEMYRSKDPRIRATNQDVLCAVFNTFGKRPDEIAPSVESQLYVTFNVITTEGKIVEMTVDMDEIFRSKEAVERHWLLVDKVFEIPVPDSGGGFKPGVGEWNEENGIVNIK